MTDTALDLIDWHGWMARWDAQQTGYLPEREARFTVMLDALEQLLPASFVLLDLACGPGAISQRVLRRFPGASSIAVDVDPVLLTLGQRVLGTQASRLQWVDADLRDPSWAARLGVSQVDAVLSTTALHWLPAGHLVRLYRDLSQLLRPGGIFLNGDHMRYGAGLPTLRTLAQQHYQQTIQTAFGSGQGEDWEHWWRALSGEPGMAELFAERARRFPEASHDDTAPIYDLHVGALRDAGFREVGVIWQRYDDRVLLAVC